ncbi:MAG: carboxypeptidase-like regulatory domain-containing protein [Cyclobacteriaceae bacterium]
MMKALIAGLFLLCCSALMAQNRNTYSIQGKVIDENGLPLPYAYVLINSLNLGTTTDSKGNYQLEKVPLGTHQITALMVGMKKQTKTIRIKNQALEGINFTLKEDAQQLGEVVVRGENEAGLLRQSAKAVDVIETKEAILQSADMGEVIAQSQGVNVRRTGGLGSGTRFSLNGLTDDQIRFFMNGIPLNFMGYTLGIANVPVNLIERVEIYKGVVPIQFGADALGGAVNLVSPEIFPGFSGAVSYQTGSFGTHRTTLDIKDFNDQTGVFIQVGGFYDFAKNNYMVDVEVPDQQGRLSEVTVPRFHDNYSAAGINTQVGVKNKSWAKEASVRVFATDFSNDIQHNNVMSIPYGEATFDRQSYGLSGIYQSPDTHWLETDVLVGYTYEQRHFLDTGRYVYTWFGERIRERGSSGELGVASDQFLWDDNLYGRVNLSKSFNERHAVQFSTAPTFVSRTGDEKRQTNPDSRDPLTAQRDLFTLISGLEYVYRSKNDKLENRLFF